MLSDRSGITVYLKLTDIVYLEAYGDGTYIYSKTILIQDQKYTIFIDQYSCKYNFDTLLWKDEPMEGKLFMRDGRTFDIKYAPMYNSFSVNGKYGFYVLDAN